MVDSDFGLCGPCWRDTPFIAGVVCESCGVPLPGLADGHRLECDDCMARSRPWQAGRAALIYRDKGRALVLALKHGDRQEIARPAGLWLAAAARPLLRRDTLIAPVPLHWTRLLKRRYNQAALLSKSLAAATGHDHCPDLLIRHRRTAPQERKSTEARFQELAGTIAPHPRRAERLNGRPVLLVDDVMTSGATLTACAEACLAGGASDVSVVTLARVQKA